MVVYKNLVTYIAYVYLTLSLINQYKISIAKKFFILDRGLIISSEYQLMSSENRLNLL